MEEQMKKRKNNQRRKRLKRKLASMTAMVLVLMLGIMGTMAYLSTVSKPKENTFTGSKGIQLELKEPGWDADDDGKPDDGDGMKEAENYTPGITIAKDPMLTNITDASVNTEKPSEWVALKVSYKLKKVTSYDTVTDTCTFDNSYSDVSYKEMKYIIEAISFNTGTDADKWTVIEDGDDKSYGIYIYNSTLAADTNNGTNGASTSKLFQHIKVLDADTLDVNFKDSTKSCIYGCKTNGSLPEFRIDVIGAAIQDDYGVSTLEALKSVTAKDTTKYPNGGEQACAEVKDILKNILANK